MLFFHVLNNTLTLDESPVAKNACIWDLIRLNEYCKKLKFRIIFGDFRVQKKSRPCTSFFAIPDKWFPVVHDKSPMAIL
jgi:hypothetical protein